MADDEVNPWAAIIGPCYTVTSMARVLGWSEAEVARAGASLEVLALDTEEGRSLYPAFQVHDGKVVEGLAEVLRTLATGTASRWTWAQWLNTALPVESPPRAIDALRAGHLDDVLLEAQRDAWSWRS